MTAGPPNVEEMPGAEVCELTVFLSCVPDQPHWDAVNPIVVTRCHRMCHSLTSFAMIPSPQENFLILTRPPPDSHIWIYL